MLLRLVVLPLNQLSLPLPKWVKLVSWFDSQEIMNIYKEEVYPHFIVDICYCMFASL